MNECRGIIHNAENENVKIVTSALTIAEIIYLKGHPKITKDKSQTIKDFFKSNYIIINNVDRAIAELARELLWDYESLRHQDAIHVATAIRARILISENIVLDSFDDDLIKLDEKIGNPPLRIRKPSAPYQYKIEDGSNE